MPITAKLENMNSAEDPRRTFETAIAKIQEGEKPRKPSQLPIVVRKQAIAPSHQTAEKRALIDAARALAQLWNVSPTLVR